MKLFYEVITLLADQHKIMLDIIVKSAGFLHVFVFRSGKRFGDECKVQLKGIINVLYM